MHSTKSECILSFWLQTTVSQIGKAATLASILTFPVFYLVLVARLVQLLQEHLAAVHGPFYVCTGISGAGFQGISP